VEKMTKKKSTTAKCAGCGKKKILSVFEEKQICTDCHNVIQYIRSNRKQLATLTEIATGSALCCSSTHKDSDTTKELPEVLDAVRYRTSDRENNTWYVSVSELSGTPVEIFASTAFDRDQHLQSRISNLTTITRLISLILRHVFMGEKLTLEKTLTQVHRSSRQKNDLPDMLVRVLSNYSTKS
jgi:hypothetical protein